MKLPGAACRWRIIPHSWPPWPLLSGTVSVTCRRCGKVAIKWRPRRLFELPRRMRRSR